MYMLYGYIYLRVCMCVYLRCVCVYTHTCMWVQQPSINTILNAAKKLHQTSTFLELDHENEMSSYVTELLGKNSGFKLLTLLTIKSRITSLNKILSLVAKI